MLGTLGRYPNQAMQMVRNVGTEGVWCWVAKESSEFYGALNFENGDICPFLVCRGLDYQSDYA